MNKYMLSLFSLPLIASDPPSVPTRPVPIRASARPTVSRSSVSEGRAGETAPVGTPPSSPIPAHILRSKRTLIGFSRGLPVEIITPPGMLISFDSTTAVYRRGNRTEIRIHNNIDIDEDHSADATE